MPRRIAAVWLFMLLLIATCFAQLNMLPHWRLVFKVKNHDFSTTETVATNPSGSAKPATSPSTRASEPSAKSDAGLQRSDTSSASSAPATSIKTGIDIARISRDGPSVFAGRSAPNARVVVLDGTQEVASAVANDNGDWSTVTDYKFSAKDPDISLKTMEPSAHAAESGGTLAAVPPKPPAVAPSTTSPAVALMKSFEKVVETAREEAKNPASSLSSPARITPPPAVTPVPMTFFYDQDVLTPEGDHSTKLLLEYLKLKHFATVTLSGHADERGTGEYNLDLSKKRLETISRQLRDGGFSGKVSLLPKGSSEPYMGVDRAHYPREELMQLDRRVELRAAE